MVFTFKRLILKGFIVLLPLLFLLLFGRDFSAFVILEEPSTITKGTTGHSLIVEISYSPTFIDDWLTASESPNYLLMLDPDWMERSTSSMEIIKERKMATGLLVVQNDEQPSLPALLEKYTAVMGELPLWVGCSPAPCTDDQVKFLFSKKINVVYAPTELKSETQFKQLPNGSIVKIQLNEEFHLKKDQLLSLTKHSFISLEENVLGYQIKTKRFPQ